MAAAKQRLGDLDVANQVLGKRMSIGCVALEVTQRCNLDCTLCYLSESSESVRDLPIEALYERIDAIRQHYGVGTNVQITGGDPTLRKHHELTKIVRYARDQGLAPALFTNGIAASKRLLVSLKDNGLSDVAFHVDMTQERPGYDSEQALNEVRQTYIERVRGLGLMVAFNTTVHDANVDAVPKLVEFFAHNADVVDMASFQLQADTGRGELGGRGGEISLESVKRQINVGAGSSLAWDRALIGHRACHSYAPTLVVDGKPRDVLPAQDWLADFLRDFEHVHVDRRDSLARIALNHVRCAWNKPWWFARAIRYLAGQLWRRRGDLWRARGKAYRLSFFVQNFMDADNLDQERVRACSFMVMTADGPLSMCAHNARREEFIRKPIDFTRRDGHVVRFDPLAPKKRQRQALATSGSSPSAASRALGS